MDKNKIATLKEKVRIDFENRIKELQDEYKKKLDAIDIVEKIFGSQGELSSNYQMQQAMPMVTKNVAGQEIMTKVMDYCPDTYSMNHGKKIFGERYPDFTFSRNSWHNTIKKKKEAGEIEEVQAGAGRAPSVFHKTDKYKPQDEAEDSNLK